jgi:hypothetical protein
MGRFGCSVCCITDGWALGSSYGGGQPGYGGGGYGYGPCLRCTQGSLAVERVHCSTEPPPPWSRVRFWAVSTIHTRAHTPHSLSLQQLRRQRRWWLRCLRQRWWRLRWVWRWRLRRRRRVSAVPGSGFSCPPLLTPPAHPSPHVYLLVCFSYGGAGGYGGSAGGYGGSGGGGYGGSGGYGESCAPLPYARAPFCPRALPAAVSNPVCPLYATPLGVASLT